jgi:hypothetical protein
MGTFGSVHGWWLIGIGFAGAAEAAPASAAAYQITMSGALVGEAAPLVGMAGFIGWALAIAILVLFIAVVIIEIDQWCSAHDCSLGGLAGRVGGWIESVTTAGKTMLTMGWSGMLVGAAAACALGSTFGPGILPIPTAQSCNFSDPDCTIAIVQDLIGEAAECALDVADPTGISSGVFGYAYSLATGNRCTPPPTSGDCSFAGGTGVLLADGTTKSIAEIAVGDWVLTEDPVTGERGVRQVTVVWVHQDQLVDLEINGDTVTTTENHPFWNEGEKRWQGADLLTPGVIVLTAEGDRVAVDGIDWSSSGLGLVYNLTVAEVHTYFVAVGDEQVLVHNYCKLPDDDVLPGFEGARRVTGKTPIQGGGSVRKRWVWRGRILEWDYKKGTVEMYSGNGKKHLGEFDPYTGKPVGKPKPRRSIKK